MSSSFSHSSRFPLNGFSLCVRFTFILGSSLVMFFKDLSMPVIYVSVSVELSIKDAGLTLPISKGEGMYIVSIPSCFACTIKACNSFSVYLSGAEYLPVGIGSFLSTNSGSFTIVCFDSFLLSRGPCR